MNLLNWLDRRHPALEYTALAPAEPLYAIALKYFAPEAFHFCHDIEGISRSYYIKPIG